MSDKEDSLEKYFSLFEGGAKIDSFKLAKSLKLLKELKDLQVKKLLTIQQLIDNIERELKKY